MMPRTIENTLKLHVCALPNTLLMAYKNGAGGVKSD